MSRVVIPMTEAQWQRRVTDLCDVLRLRWFHSGDSRRDSGAGFPDLVIAGPYGVIFAELKKQDGRTSPEQHAWIDTLCAAGQTAAIWRPNDWPEVQAELERIAGRTLTRWNNTTRGRSS